MVVTPELRAQILRLYLADQWRIGTIARQLLLHRDTVRRVLAVSNVLRAPAAPTLEEMAQLAQALGWVPARERARIV